MISTFSPLADIMPIAGDIKQSKLNCDVVNMSYFEFLAENKIASKDGYVRKEPDEVVSGITCGDRLRLALLFEESEYFEALQDDKY